MVNLQEIEDNIDSANEWLEEIEVSLKLLLTSFKTESNSVIGNEVLNETKSKVRLSEILLPSFRSAYCVFANFKTQFTNLIINNDRLYKGQFY